MIICRLQVCITFLQSLIFNTYVSYKYIQTYITLALIHPIEVSYVQYLY